MNSLIVGNKIIPINNKSITHIPKWAQDFMRGQSKISAVERFTQSAWANRCVQIRQNTLAQIPWALGHTNKEGKFEAEDRNSPFSTSLREVNEEMNWVDLIRATEGDMLIFGRSFWLKLGGRVLQRISPPRMTPKIESNILTGWTLDKVKKKGKFISRDEIVYFHIYDPISDLSGVPPIEVASASIDIELQCNIYMGAFFANNAMPAVIMETAQQMTDGDFTRISRWWNKTFRGAKNQHKIGMVDKGLNVKVLGYPLKDLALEQVRAEVRRDICSVFGVPPAIAGAWEAANYAASKEQRESLYEDTVIPRAEYLAGVINAELMPQFNNLEFKWLFNELPIMQVDVAMERKSIAELVKAGVITPEAGALQLGYEQSEAGIGPVQTRIVDDDTDVVQGNKSALHNDLMKWQRKALKAEGKGKKVTFESDNIPPSVSEVITNKLDKTPVDVKKVFAPFLEINQ